MKVPFLDLGRLHRSIRAELDSAYDEVLHTSSFVGSRTVAGFESAFAGVHGLRFAAGCGSGTDALALALRAAGVGDGDEVVVPAMTFVATAEAVVHAGATPVVADVDATTLLLDQPSVDAVRTPRTRAVVPVDLYGHAMPPADLRAWRDSGLVVVEDAAQAHLATYEGEPVGTHADATCFSFYPGKNLGALGDGGMLLTDDEAIAARTRLLRDHGRTTKYVHDEIGWCSRLDGLQAAFLHAKLPHLPAWTEARRHAAARYRDRLPSGLLVPWADGAVHHLLVVRVSRRDEVQEGMTERGIATGVHYPVPLSLQPSMRLWSRSAPAAEAAAAEVLSLPMDPLMTAADVDAVCDALIEVMSSIR